MPCHAPSPASVVTTVTPLGHWLMTSRNVVVSTTRHLLIEQNIRYLFWERGDAGWMMEEFRDRGIYDRRRWLHAVPPPTCPWEHQMSPRASAANGVRPIAHHSLVDRVTDELHRAILNGDLAPGSTVSIVDLCQRFDISHIPVREALRRLESEGVISLRPGRSALVATADQRRAGQHLRAAQADRGRPDLPGAPSGSPTSGWPRPRRRSPSTSASSASPPPWPRSTTPSTRPSCTTRSGRPTPTSSACCGRPPTATCTC